MKKLLLIIALVCTTYLAEAQAHPHAIGIRLGGYNGGSGGEISYQHGRGDRNRLEFDVGWVGNKTYKNFYVVGIYHWMWNLAEGLNLYAGPGGALGYVQAENYNRMFFSVGGQVGVEYDFNTLNAPFTLSFDIRPMFNFVGNNSDFGVPFGLGIRYTW